MNKYDAKRCWKNTKKVLESGVDSIMAIEEAAKEIRMVGERSTKASFPCIMH